MYTRKTRYTNVASASEANAMRIDRYSRKASCALIAANRCTAASIRPYFAAFSLGSFSGHIFPVTTKKVINKRMKDEVKMDANRLIAEVYKRPALWNQRHISYHNREVTNRVWMEIATIFKLPKPVLKAKWKGLRDTFRAELKKELVYQKSNYHRNRPIWIHFKNLQFLKEQMVPRPPIWERNCNRNSDIERTIETEGGQNGDSASKASNGDDNSSLDNVNGDSQMSIDTVNHQVEVKQEPEETFQNLEFHNVSENLADNEMMLQNLSPEQVLMGDGDSIHGLNVDPLEGNRCDDNYFFLMSLLPHIRTLPAERRMLLRMQMQELVYKEVYKKNSSENVSTS